MAPLKRMVRISSSAEALDGRVSISQTLRTIAMDGRTQVLECWFSKLGFWGLNKKGPVFFFFCGTSH